MWSTHTIHDKGITFGSVSNQIMWFASKIADAKLNYRIMNTLNVPVSFTHFSWNYDQEFIENGWVYEMIGRMANGKRELEYNTHETIYVEIIIHRNKTVDFFFFLSSSLHLLASYGLEMVEWFIRKIRINQITKQNAFIFIWFCILPERECILGACMRTEGVFYACLSHTIKIIRIQIRIFMVIMGQLQLPWFKCDWFSTTFVTWLGFHTSVFALWLCFLRVSTRSWEGIWSIVEIFSQWRWIV